MQYKLSQIANINFGPYLKTDIKGDVKYLLSSHFDKINQPTLFKGSYILLDNLEEKYLLKENDLILTGKGNRTFAWAYKPENGLMIASSLFYVINVNPKILLNEYLAYFLNSSKIHNKLIILGSGATIRSLPKNELYNLKIDIPSLEEQKKIIQIANTMKKDIELSNKILNKKIKLHKKIISTLTSQQPEANSQ